MVSQIIYYSRAGLSRAFGWTLLALAGRRVPLCQRHTHTPLLGSINIPADNSLQT